MQEVPFTEIKGAEFPAGVVGVLSASGACESNGEANWIYQSEFKTAAEAVNGLREFAIQEAQESFVLLKNENGALPVSATAMVSSSRERNPSLPKSSILLRRLTKTVSTLMRGRLRRKSSPVSAATSAMPQ